MKPIFIIEHLEPKLYKWCEIEYENISNIVGKRNLWFTNMKTQANKLKKFGKVTSKSVKSMNLKQACVLDPEAPRNLTPKDSKKFKYFIFGGILGDYPPKKRTKKELTQFIENAKVRNIGKKQFSTDNAVYVTYKISKGTPMNKIKFKNKIQVKINNIESVILPYLYPIVNGNPQMSPKIIEYLKKKKSF